MADYENLIAGEINGSNRDDAETKKQNTMSATEHFTGEYYFNGKPIYAKSFYIESLPNATIKNYNHSIQDVDNIWYDCSKC